MMNQEEHTLSLHKVNFKISMLRYSLRDNSDAYILAKGNITVNNTAAKGSAANNTNKKAIFKNCAPLTDCINKINNTQADNAKSIDTLLLDKINFKTSVLRYSLRDNSGDAYILVKGNITVNKTAAEGAAANNTNKKAIFKNCAPFTDCINKINNTQVDNAEGIDIGMPMYNLIEYNDNYSIKSGSLWQYCKDIPAVNDNGNIVDFNK